MTVTAPTVATWLKEDQLANDPELIEVCTAVETWYAATHFVPVDALGVALPRSAAVDQGLKMTAARIYKRRNTPEARDQFGAFVVRFDADVEGLLADTVLLGFA